MKLYALTFLLAIASVAPEQRYFKYDRAIDQTPAIAAQTCLPLDVETFTHASPHLADLRLYRDNVETPYVINIAVPTQAPAASISLLNRGLHGKQVTFDAAMPEGNYSDLTLGITAQNFIATVTVFGSHTATSERGTRLGSYTIFDLTQQKLGRSTVLHLPESNFTYLHFEIDGPLTPEDLTGITVDRLPTSQPTYKLVAETSTNSRKEHSSVFTLTLPARVPVDRLVFTPAAAPAMFSRDVHVEVQPTPARPINDDSEPPSPVSTTGNLLRLHSTQDGHRIDEDRLTLTAPAVDFDTPTQWTITIENGDDVPLNTAVRLEMLERDLCFAALGQANYTLYYGDPSLAPPVYDYAALFTRQPDAAHASEGPEQQNPLYQNRPDLRPFTEKHPALLWTALLTVIALLGSIAVRSFQTDRSNHPPSGPA